MFTKKSVPVYLILILLSLSLLFVTAGMFFIPTNTGGECMGCMWLVVVDPFFELIFDPLQIVLSPIPHFVLSSFSNLPIDNVWVFLIGGLFLKFTLISLLVIIPFLPMFYIIKRKVLFDNQRRWKITVWIVYVCITVLFSVYTLIPRNLVESESISNAQRISYICGSDVNCFHTIIKGEIGQELDDGIYFPRLYFTINEETVSLYSKDQISRHVDKLGLNDVFKLDYQVSLGIKNYSDFSHEECRVYASYYQIGLDDPVGVCVSKLTNLQPINFILLGEPYETFEQGRIIKLGPFLFGLGSLDKYAMGYTFYSTDQLGLRFSITQASLDTSDLFSKLLEPPVKSRWLTSNKRLVSTKEVFFLGHPTDILYLDSVSRISFIVGDSFFIVEAAEISEKYDDMSDFERELLSMAEKVAELAKAEDIK